MGQAVKVVLGVALTAGAVGFLGWRVMQMQSVPDVLPEDAPGHLMQEQPGLTVRADKRVVDPFGKEYGYEGKDGHLVNAKGERINRDGSLWVQEEEPPVPRGGVLVRTGPFTLELGAGERLKGHEKGVLDMAFSPDGKMLVSGGADGELILWDVETGKELRRVTTGLEQVMQVAVSGDGKRVSGVGLTHGWGVWDVATGERVGRGDRPVTLGGAVFFPDSGHLAIGEEDAVGICDIGTGELVNEVPTGEVVDSLCVSGDGEQLAVGGAETVSVVNRQGVVTGAVMRVWGSQGEQMQARDRFLGWVRTVTFDGAGRVMFLDGNGPWRWDVGTGKLEGWSAPVTLRMAVVGDWVCQTDGKEEVEVTDLAEEAATGFASGGPAHVVAVSRDGKLAVGYGGEFEGATYKGTGKADIVVFGAEGIAAGNREWRAWVQAGRQEGGGAKMRIGAELETWE